MSLSTFQSITCTGTDNLTRTTKKQNTQLTQNNNAKGALVNSITDILKKSRLREWTVALYNIRPGNGAGLFFQPQRPHGAYGWCNCRLWSECSTGFHEGQSSTLYCLSCSVPNRAASDCRVEARRWSKTPTTASWTQPRQPCSDALSTAARCSPCLEDVGHWMIANRLRLNPTKNPRDIPICHGIARYVWYIEVYQTDQTDIRLVGYR